MNSPKKTFAIVAIGAIVLLAGWALFRPELLFVDKRVDEAFPGTVATGTAAASTASAPATSRASGGTGMAMSDAVLRSGNFKGVAHETKGKAAIHELGDGRRVLRLSEFETSNGPDLRVFLVAAGDAADSDTVKKAGYVELGSLKGNIGDQNYDVPKTVDLGKYRAVTIWCNRFSVNFGTAALQ